MTVKYMKIYIIYYLETVMFNQQRALSDPEWGSEGGGTNPLFQKIYCTKSALILL